MALFDLLWAAKNFFRFISTKGVAARPAATAAGVIVLAIGSFGNYPVLSQGLEGENQQPAGFGIRGDALIEAYHSNGTLYRTWEGDNSLDDVAINAIVSCATGNSTEPSGYTKCDSWMTAIQLAQTTRQPNGETDISNIAENDTINHLIPPGCDPTSSTLCIGWQSQAIFDEITQDATVNSVWGYDNTTHIPFDYIFVDPPIQVAPGDTVNVTIDFRIEQQ